MLNNDTNEFVKNITTILKANFPLVYIPTWEEDRAIGLIYDISIDKALGNIQRRFFKWNMLDGLGEYDEENNEYSYLGEDTEDPLNALNFIDDFEENAIFILQDFHVYFEDDNLKNPEIIRYIRNIAKRIKNSTCVQCIIFISPKLILPDELQKDITVLDLDLPSFQDIRCLLEEVIEDNRITAEEQGRTITVELQDGEFELLAKAALGLTLQEAEKAFSRAMVNDDRLDISDVDTILEEKQQVIRKAALLEFIKVNQNIHELGGLDNLKNWLQKRNRAWLDEARDYGLPFPKGVLLTGVPGCGKSLAAKSIASLWRLPLLRLDAGRIYASFIGSSEANIRQVILAAEALAPSILWIDEIEKGFAKLDFIGDSGASTRVLAAFLTWMQEKTKPVFVVATANDIQALPPEMLRKGRFDEIFFVDLPTQQERMDIFALHLKKRLTNKKATNGFKHDQLLLSTLSGLTEGFSGAEIEQVVISALFEAFHANRAIMFEDLEKAIAGTVPLSITQSEYIHAVREWAGTRAVLATSKG